MKITREMQLKELQRMRRQAELDDLIFIGPKWRPTILLSLPRLDRAAENFLEGLRQHYFECVAGARIEAWKAAAISSIGLLSELPFESVRREDLR